VPRPGYVRLVHWKEEEVPERAARLEALGYRVDGAVPGTSIGVRALTADPPIAFVIDLGRLPSHGLEVARSIRQSRALRPIPILFAGGKPDKAARVRAALPDAAYAAWDDLAAPLAAAIAHPPPDPVVPTSDSGPRSTRPLAAKLGLKEGHLIALLGAPPGFESTLGTLPGGATLRRGNRGHRDVTIWFVTTRRDLDRRIGPNARAVGDGTLWIAWPKATSDLETDLVESRVQAAGLALGLVDTKVVAIDDDWSALRFTRRRTPGRAS
jgi:CheY-like chemotaxis protein